MTPDHVVILDGTVVRLYHSPVAEADFSWAAFDDLLKVAEFSAEARVFWVKRWRDQWPEQIHDLPDGTVIVPQVAGAGLFEWGVDQGWDRAPVLLQTYIDASSELFCVRHHNVPRDRFRVMCQEAALRQAVPVPGATTVQ